MLVSVQVLSLEEENQIRCQARRLFSDDQSDIYESKEFLSVKFRYTVPWHGIAKKRDYGRYAYFLREVRFRFFEMREGKIETSVSVEFRFLAEMFAWTKIILIAVSFLFSSWHIAVRKPVLNSPLWMLGVFVLFLVLSHLFLLVFFAGDFLRFRFLVWPKILKCQVSR